MGKQKQNYFLTKLSKSLFKLNKLPRKIRDSEAFNKQNRNSLEGETVLLEVKEKLLAATEAIITANTVAIAELEENWSEGVTKAKEAAPSLSEQEILMVLADLGSTKAQLVDKPKKIYLQRIEQAKELKNIMSASFIQTAKKFN
ncbi:hypothetical protein KQI33_06930 [Enterococcus devriesei]|uniref:hypothetical protein n=1 Tax=Enterococcus devriesei TaxID=319970 RepID=UPI001C106FA1|nr:hypothetical protein [Enterococcus devriesei]MBU5365103.1 hypothetical protein [Enterococcus devriesei]